MPPSPTKRPIITTVASIPEPSIEPPIQGTAIVVIHPGSYSLRIGRASDTFPVILRHVIARRHKNENSVRFEDAALLRPGSMTKESLAMMEEGLGLASELMECMVLGNGSPRPPTHKEQLIIHNKHAKPDMSELSDRQWTKTDHKPAYLIGEEALNLNPNDEYNIHWPIKYGRFNLHRSAGGSLTSVLADLETIWSVAIQKYLDIPLKDLRHYRAVVVIPDVYERKHIKELMNLLLIQLGFGGAFIHQEAVCATFGAGLSYACVVDVGDHKTSVVCVEDGMSHRNTRLSMDYGGSDVTRTFYWLLKKFHFPYKECNLSHRMDIFLLQDLKEQHCHLDQLCYGMQTYTFQVSHPGFPVKQYAVRLGDERILAPLGLFVPELFGILQSNVVHIQQRNEGDPEDIFDDYFLIQSQIARKTAKESDKEAANQSTELTTQGEEGSLDQLDEDSNDAPGETTAPVGCKETEISPDVLLGIDQAILHSIERCPSDDMKKKMYSCILVVGGGMMFPGLQSWLHTKLYPQIPYSLRPDQVDIITGPKVSQLQDMDPRMTCWKGAAVMSCLDTTQELWIRYREWKQSDVKMLREKAPFLW